MDNPIEDRLRELMRAEAGKSTPVDELRLVRVLHKAHMRAGFFDLITLFAHWGWVISEGGSRGLKHSRPVNRRTADSRPVTPNSTEKS